MVCVTVIVTLYSSKLGLKATKSSQRIIKQTFNKIANVVGRENKDEWSGYNPNYPQETSITVYGRLLTDEARVK